MRKIFSAASGRTTVPMSRPSIITLCCSAILRCMSSRYALTSGMAETSEARMDISGVLMRPDTSSPLRYMCCAPSSP